MDYALLREGTPFWVTVPLVQTSTTVPLDIVIPQPANPMPIGGRLLMGDGLAVNARLIVLGFAWSFVVGTGNAGFTLQWRTFDPNTPAGTPHSDVIYTALSPDKVTTAFSQGSVTPCFIPGTGGATGSPGDRGAIANPAKLQVLAVSAVPTAGTLLVWGIHTDGDWRPGKVFTGSPDANVFGTTTAKK
jgi:hypothetical protein